MSNTHTPGPWDVERDEQLEKGEVVGVWLNIGSRHRYIIGTDGLSCQGPEDEANARLIAAAPDMYDALKAAIASGMVPVSSVSEGGAVKYSAQVQAADLVRAAIAKAEGRT
jgi:hypothetical protein